ncbi:MAG: YidH family protein [Actinomycetales bacterium]
MNDPDPRWAMANERTALAWVRTSLTLLAGGVGLTSLARVAGLPRIVDFASAAICLLGAWIGASAFVTWRQRDAAMRAGEPLPATRALPLLIASVVVVALALAVYLVASGF